MKEKVSFTPDKRSWHPSPLLGQIVFVTTINEDGQSNVAPKSWISMMAFDPPLVALGCNLSHWTARNILRSHEFAINIVGADLAEAVWHSHTLPHPRPVERIGLTPIPAQLIQPPLIEECRAHLECKFVQHHTFANEVILFGQVIAGSVDRQALLAEDPYAYLQPIMFLEANMIGIIEKAHTIRKEEKR